MPWSDEMKLIDPQDPFYRPIWLRIVITAACLGWAVVELTSGTVFWAILFGAAGAYCAWQFFVIFDPDRGDEEDKP